MTLKVKKDTRLGPKYEVLFDYNNKHEQTLHPLMVGIESMLNCVPSCPITKTKVYGYNANIPEFIPDCLCQSIQFEMVWTPRTGGNHLNILIRHPDPLYPISGCISPTYYIESCKYKVLTRLIFGLYDYWEIPYKSNEQLFNELRNWVYGHFGYNARNKIWPNFEEEVSKELRRKYPTREDFEKYAEESAILYLKDEKINPGSKYYNDRLQFWVDFYTRDINKYYKGE